MSKIPIPTYWLISCCGRIVGHTFFANFILRDRQRLGRESAIFMRIRIQTSSFYMDACGSGRRSMGIKRINKQYSLFDIHRFTKEVLKILYMIYIEKSRRIKLMIMDSMIWSGYVVFGCCQAPNIFLMVQPWDRALSLISLEFAY